MLFGLVCWADGSLPCWAGWHRPRCQQDPCPLPFGMGCLFDDTELPRALRMKLVITAEPTNMGKGSVVHRTSLKQDDVHIIDTLKLGDNNLCAVIGLRPLPLLCCWLHATSVIVASASHSRALLYPRIYPWTHRLAKSSTPFRKSDSVS